MFLSFFNNSKLVLSYISSIYIMSIFSSPFKGYDSISKAIYHLRTVFSDQGASKNKYKKHNLHLTPISLQKSLTSFNEFYLVPFISDDLSDNQSYQPLAKFVYLEPELWNHFISSVSVTVIESLNRIMADEIEAISDSENPVFVLAFTGKYQHPDVHTHLTIGLSGFSVSAYLKIHHPDWNNEYPTLRSLLNESKNRDLELSRIYLDQFSRMPTPVQQPYSKPYSERVYTICASNSGSSSSSMVQSFTPYPTDELTLDHTYVNDDDSFSQNESDYADTYEDRFDSTSGISTLNDTFSDAICLHDYNLTGTSKSEAVTKPPKTARPVPCHSNFMVLPLVSVSPTRLSDKAHNQFASTNSDFQSLKHNFLSNSSCDYIDVRLTTRPEKVLVSPRITKTNTTVAWWKESL